MGVKKGMSTKVLTVAEHDRVDCLRHDRVGRERPRTREARVGKTHFQFG